MSNICNHRKCPNNQTNNFCNKIAVSSPNKRGEYCCIIAKTKFAMKNKLNENVLNENENSSKFKTYSGQEYLPIPFGFIISSLPPLSPPPLLRAERKKNGKILIHYQ